MPQIKISGLDPATGSVVATGDRFAISRETSPGVWETFYVTQQWMAAYTNALLTTGASAGMDTFAEVEAALNSRWRVLARGNVAIPLTGTTAETDFVLFTVPGGAMGPNGAIRITTLASAGANNANAKNIRYRFGGNAFQNFSLASALSNDCQRTIVNRNAQNSQVAAPGATTTFGNSASAVATAAIDTSADFDIRITGLLANAGDTLTLERYLIEVLYGA